MAALDVNDFDPSTIYTASYFSGDEYAAYLRDRAVFDRTFRDRLNLVRRFRPGGHLLEIGCAYGLFLRAASAHYRVRGYDIASEPVRYAATELGLDARCENFLDAAEEPESADVVAMWDTIEHLPRPDRVVEKAAAVLRPGGILVLTTGDSGSLVATVRRERWRMIHPPTHLHYFNRRNLERLVRRFGLVPTETRYVGVRRSLYQIAYSIFILRSGRFSGLVDWIGRTRIGNWSIKLNTFDVMLLVARKTDADA